MKSSIWFSADHHFDHKSKRGGIIEYCKRPFDTIEEMDEALIGAWNNVVGVNDWVYHLGDVTLGKNAYKYFAKLNGQKLVLTNVWHHDKRWVTGFPDITNVNYLPPLHVLEYPELSDTKWPQVIVLCHYPLAHWDRQHFGAFHLHGHSHGKYKGKGKILDVGVDNIYKLFGEYRPINLEEVIEYMKKVEAGFWGQWLRYIPALQRIWE